MDPPDLPGRADDQDQSVWFDLLFARRAACQPRSGRGVSSRFDSGHESHGPHPALPPRTCRDGLLVLALRGLHLGSGYYGCLHHQREVLSLWILTNNTNTDLKKGSICQSRPRTRSSPHLESPCWRPASLPVLLLVWWA